jgi:hypothetical protein
METKLKMVYWKDEKFWVGKLLDHPDIMTQGETMEDLAFELQPSSCKAGLRRNKLVRQEGVRDRIF